MTEQNRIFIRKADTEADTCRKYVLPKLYAAGWIDDQISEQKTFTDGRIVVLGEKYSRQPQKRADYILRYRSNLMVAVIEAKKSYKHPADGIQQAKEYAKILDLKFAYSTNGHSILEHDFLTGVERELGEFPRPEELWKRQNTEEILKDKTCESRYLSNFFPLPGKRLRYYQEIAINRTMKAILTGQKRILINMATGTGKTDVAFQICRKLWEAKWNVANEHRKPRILYLSDRTFLIDDPAAKTFSSFGDARWKIHGEALKSREMYFATYQAIARDERRPGLYRDYSPDFFDLIIVDECHRGSAKDESNWREILTYFGPAYQIGMTATPLREDNRDTYVYFGSPIYTYSLRQGIDDGFLAPYKVHRIVTSVDATGWRPSKDEVDLYGQAIPDEEYTTPDFESIISLRARTNAIAKNITEFLKARDSFAKTIVFCVDQDHSEQMRQALNNLNSDIVKNNPDYVVRIVSDEGEIGKGYLSRFQELETTTPCIVTTSKLLTTGVDIPTCKNIVIARVINSMTEFKQIIGRGTRVRDDYGKLFFNILDYTGSASRLFADAEFDGDPIEITETKIDEPIPLPQKIKTQIPVDEDVESKRKKYYVDGGQVEIAAHIVYELDSNGNKLRVIEFIDYVREKISSMFTSAASLRSHWTNLQERSEIISKLERHGITLSQVMENTKQYDADPFDLLCHVAFNSPLRTRRERAEKLRKGKYDFWDYFKPEARAILDEIIDKYVEFGIAELNIPDILKVPPISSHGNIMEISELFGGPEVLKDTLDKVQTILYQE